MRRELHRASNPRPIYAPRGRVEDDSVPMSPTDAALSPCTEAIRRMHSPERRAAADDEVDDSPRYSIHKHVRPRIAPTSLPMVLSSDTAHAWSVLTALQWDCSRVPPPRLNLLPVNGDIQEHLQRFAAASARALLLDLDSGFEDDQTCILITSHQLCVVGDEIRDIPMSRCQAHDWLCGYSDASVKMLTAISVTNTETRVTTAAVDEVVIQWRSIPEDVIDRVIRKGAVYQCAGAVDVLEKELNIYISDIEGAVDCAYGMPVKTLTKAMATVLEGRDSF